MSIGPKAVPSILSTGVNCLYGVDTETHKPLLGGEEKKGTKDQREGDEREGKIEKERNEKEIDAESSALISCSFVACRSGRQPRRNGIKFFSTIVTGKCCPGSARRPSVSLSARETTLARNERMR